MIAVTPHARVAVLVREELTGTDEYGNDVLTPTDVPIAGVSWWPSATSESHSGGDTVTTRYGSLWPADCGLKAQDKVRLTGETGVWNVDGDPRAHFSSITGASGRLFAWLERVSG